MKKASIVTSFGRYSDTELMIKAQVIVEKMKDNVYFIDPDPAIVDIESALAAFEAAITYAKEGNKLQLLDRKSKRLTLVNLLVSLSLYVKLKAKDNGQALASSGFTMRKTPEPVGILSKPQNFKVEPGYAGTIKISLKTIQGAKAYLYEYRKKGMDEWTVLLDTKSKMLLNGLESGTQYEFRATGIGVIAQRVYSDIISSFIL